MQPATKIALTHKLIKEDSNPNLKSVQFRCRMVKMKKQITEIRGGSIDPLSEPLIYLRPLTTIAHQSTNLLSRYRTDNTKNEKFDSRPVQNTKTLSKSVQ